MQYIEFKSFQIYELFWFMYQYLVLFKVVSLDVLGQANVNNK